MNASIPQINWELIKAKRQYWLFPVGVFVFALVSFVVVVVPSISDTFELREEIDSLENEAEKLASKREALETISEANLDRQLDAVQAALPNDKPYMRALLSLMHVAEENNVQIRNFAFNPGLVASESAELSEEQAAAVEGGALGTVNLELSAVGNYEELNAYLQRVEEMKPLVLLEETAINSLNEERQETDMKLLVHYSFPPNEVGSVSAPLPEFSADELAALDRARALQEVEFEQITPSSPSNRENPFSF